ncbi:MAG: DUF177 domain-containing protein [Xanthobacteraceae bacterium]
MAHELSWKFPVVVAGLPDDGKDFRLLPDEAARNSLAQHAGVLAIPALEARLHVRPDGGGGATVAGTMQGAVTQNCVVTLEPFDNPISDEISLRFAPPEAIAQESDGLIEIGADDPPDPLVGGALDLAAVVAEFLALAIDPYPRRPGAVFTPPGEDTARPESSPFAALAKLSGRQSDKNG